MKTEINESTAGRFLYRKLGVHATAVVFEGRIRDFLIHLRQTAPDRANTPTAFYSPRINPQWPDKGSFRVTRGIDGKRFELVLRGNKFIGREVK